ncbi:MAG: PqqD family protein [Anaerolineae bacterium]|nr:PqqD family protein [Anaerolineae bacterium]
MAATLDSYPRRDATFRLRSGAVMIDDRYQGRTVRLDEFSSQLWLRIDGLTTVRDIAADIARARQEPRARVEVHAAAMTGVLLTEGLLFLDREPSPQPYHLAIPTDEQDPAETLISKRACGWVEHHRSRSGAEGAAGEES